MPTVPAYAVTSLTSPVTLSTIERRAPGPTDVVIQIAWAGICHTDIHMSRGDWGEPPYPLTVGHEIVGWVTETGSAVTKHAVGDRVGVGCMVNSCRECENCVAGLEQYCLAGPINTYNSVDRDGSITQGGYSTHIVVDEHFVLSIPEAIPFEKAAPLLCAGITTYSPLRHWNVGPGSKVAIVGVGGLGHMGVKIGHALGAEVTALSQGTSKRDDSLEFGAEHFYATRDSETFEKLANYFDLIVNTVSSQIDLNAYLGLLRLDGTIVSVGAPPGPIPVTLFTLMANRRSFASSSVGGIRETQEMLDFCADHGITPEVEIIAANEINQAWDRLLAGDVRYRFVIDISTIGT